MTEVIFKRGMIELPRLRASYEAPVSPNITVDYMYK